VKFLFKSEVIDYTFISNHSSSTILFLHGWGGDKNSFTSTINLLRSKYNILTITIPTILPTITIWTLHDYLTLIEEIVAIHNIKNMIIVCHSFGFRIVSLMNGKFVIKKLIITGGAGLKKIKIIKKIAKNNDFLLLKHDKFKFLYKKLASKDYIRLTPINKETFKKIVNSNSKNLIKFSCPLLLFWGKKDFDTPLNLAKKIKKVNSAKLITTNSGHFAYLEDNDYFNHCILEFLK